jgi:hypothetical protein
MADEAPRPTVIGQVSVLASAEVIKAADIEQVPGPDVEDES